MIAPSHKYVMCFHKNQSEVAVNTSDRFCKNSSGILSVIGNLKSKTPSNDPEIISSFARLISWIRLGIKLINIILSQTIDSFPLLKDFEAVLCAGYVYNVTT